MAKRIVYPTTKHATVSSLRPPSITLIPKDTDELPTYIGTYPLVWDRLLSLHEFAAEIGQGQNQPAAVAGPLERQSNG